MPDGRTPAPGGWNRIHLIVDDIAAEVERLRAAGLTFRNDIVTGPGGQQILLDDPSGNPIELFQPAAERPTVSAPGLAAVLREWGRIGCIGFGGPPTHIALLRELCVERRRWLDAQRLRGRGRGLQPAARAGVDAARDLLRLAGPRPAGRARRRRRVHRARPRR